MKTFFFNPFEQFSERTLILFGIPVTIILSLMGAYFNARFDGVLDLHFISPTFLNSTVADNAINVGVLTIFLFTLGKIRNSKTRFIDIFSTSLIARIPYYFLPIFNWNDLILLESEKLKQKIITLQATQVPEFDGVNMVLIALFTIVSLFVLAWYISLLYKGYQVAANAKGAFEMVLFAVTLISAEIFSKIIFYLLN